MIDRARVERMLTNAQRENQGVLAMAMTPQEQVTLLTQHLALLTIVEALEKRRMARHEIRDGQSIIVCDFCYRYSPIGWVEIEHAESCEWRRARELLGRAGE